MEKPYIYAHRGAMGYCIENTMEAFQKAVEMKVGIETDIHLTKDQQLVCFHDPSFKIKNDWVKISNSTLNELRLIRFKDGREIPTINEVFNEFSYCPKIFRYSCDIENVDVGKKLIDLVDKYSNYEQVEITDTRIKVLINLRDYNKKIKLIHTIPYHISKIDNKNIKFNEIHQNDIKILNIKANMATIENFKNIIDNGFKCYCWGVNSKSRMKKILNLKYNGEFIKALYTNYPDILKKLRDQYYD